VTIRHDGSPNVYRLSWRSVRRTMRDSSGGHNLSALRETVVPLEELNQHGEPQAGGPSLIRQQQQFTRGERPVLNERFRRPLPLHTIPLPGCRSRARPEVPSITGVGTPPLTSSLAYAWQPGEATGKLVRVRLPE